MRRIQGFGAIVLGGLLLFNVANIVSLFSLALGVALLVGATLTFLVRLQERQLSFNSILVALMGVALVLNRDAALQGVAQLIALFMVLIGTANLWQFRRRRVPQESLRFNGGILLVVLGGVLFLFPGLPFAILRVVLALGLIFFGITRLHPRGVMVQSFTWNEWIRRQNQGDPHPAPDVIDVEVEDVDEKDKKIR
jgi:uncharacterized membrane protein HdeD (DUF308 family)